MPLVFCNVVGEEEELVVTSEEGHQRSKSNLNEKDKVVSLEKIHVGSNFYLSVTVQVFWYLSAGTNETKARS